MFDSISRSDDYWKTRLPLITPTTGLLPIVGSQAPDFYLTNLELENVTLENYENECKVLNILPSLDIPSCMESAQKLNGSKVELENAAVLIISADLPFAQRQFVEMADLNDVTTLSTFRSSTFATDYGVQIVSGDLAGLMAQAIVVLNEKNKIIHTQLLTELAQEINYAAIFLALKNAKDVRNAALRVEHPLKHLHTELKDTALLKLDMSQPDNRRNSFRINIPASNGCYCKIVLPIPEENAPMKHKQAYLAAVDKIQNKINEKLKKQHHSIDIAESNQNSRHYMELHLHDISAAGCSMLNYDEEFSPFLMPHTIYENCTIFIPNYGEATISFQLMSKHKVEHNKKGEFNELIGIEFIGMLQSVEFAIAYYVQEIERQRISLFGKYNFLP
jgi:thiol peroxidase